MCIYIYICTYIYIYLILRAEIARARKRFWHPLLTSKPPVVTQSAQTTIPPYQH